MLLSFAGPAARLNLGSLVLRAEAGAVEPPMSWNRQVTAFGPSLLLIGRSQPCFEPGAQITLDDGQNPLLLATVEGPHDLETLAEGLSPADTLGLLRFIASKATGVLRHSDDSGLAETCHRIAEAVMSPERVALPVALCAHDMVMWALPQAAAEAGQERGVSYVIGRRRVRRIAVRGETFMLRDRQFEDGYLLPPGGAGPIHLGPAGGRLPSLQELGRRQDPQSRTQYRRGLAELARRATVDEESRRRLRDLQLLSPTEKPHQLIQPGRPFSGALELALCDHGGGVFLRGWIRDPLRLVAGLTLRSPYGDIPLAMEELSRFGRADLTERFANSPHGGPGLKPGFALHLPDAALRPVPQWSMRMELTTGDSVNLTAPPAILHAHGARDAVLGAIAPGEVTPAIMARCIEPAVARLHLAAMARTAEPDVIRIGSLPTAAPAVSLVVPLYRNLRFVKPQYAALAREPGFGAMAELVLVLDSPEQRREVEHLLRGLHGVYGLPVTLVVQPANYGYASACNAGAAKAAGATLLMLNSDVVPAARGWLAPMLAALDEDPRLLAVGPKLLFEDGSLQHAGLFFERGPEDEWFNNHFHKGYPGDWPAAQVPRRVPGVTGAALLVRREAFEAVGGFTTDYVIGDYEDSDLCLKLRARGGEIGYVPGSTLYHFERQSIREHTGYARTLASAYNRRLHHRRWSDVIEQLMDRTRPRAGRGGL